MTAIGDDSIEARRRPAQTSVRAIVLGATVALAVAALIASTALRFAIAGRQPLWLDEIWTGSIVGQPSFASFCRQVWLDANAPLYYLVMHLWQAPFGLSDASLRLPSAIFGAAAPLLIALRGVAGLDRPARLTWAVLLALWIPGIWLSGDARCYALLMLFCTAQTLAFVRLLSRPTLGRTALWCGLATLAILTHYHAAILAALQGLAYLALCRGRAMRTWPAALLLAPAAAWLAFHAERVALFAQPGVAWYPILKIKRLGAVASYLVGSQDFGFTLLAIGVLALVLGFFLRPPKPSEAPSPTLRLWAAFGAAAAGVAIVIALGFLRPSFVERYLTPFVPGLMLGIALIAQRLSRRVPIACAAVMVAAAGFATPWAWKEIRHGWRFYTWEAASQDLMRGRPERLVFVWDHPASAVMDPEQLEGIGGFFFRRAHRAVEVRSVVLPRDLDPNPPLLAAAQGPRTAILWAYDRGVLGTAARRFLPRLSVLDPTLTCRNYGRGSVGVLACDRQGSVKTVPP